MKTTYTIGRDPQADIVINDGSDVVSRLHAILRFNGRKMTIEDRSKNGTHINGIRISSGVQVPVTRKDRITFSHVADLDWNSVPRPAASNLFIWLAVAVCVIALSTLGYIYRDCIFPKPAPEVKIDTLVVKDTVTIEKEVIKKVPVEVSSTDNKGGNEGKTDGPVTPKEEQQEIIF